jgi:hypothetical protein
MLLIASGRPTPRAWIVALAEHSLTVRVDGCAR